MVAGGGGVILVTTCRKLCVCSACWLIAAKVVATQAAHGSHCAAHGPAGRSEQKHHEWMGLPVTVIRESHCEKLEWNLFATIFRSLLLHGCWFRRASQQSFSRFQRLMARSFASFAQICIENLGQAVKLRWREVNHHAACSIHRAWFRYGLNIYGISGTGTLP